MEHKYFCTYCGRELNQGIVLFDLQHVLTGDAKERFDILSFRLTKEELDKLLNAGTRGDQSYVHYDLTLEEFLKHVSNAHNLNDPVIRGLTMEQITSFLEAMTKKEYGDAFEPSTGGGDEFDDLFGGTADTDSRAAPVQEDTPDDHDWPEPIKALRSKDTTNKSLAETQKMIQHDLKILKKLFGESGSFHMELLPLEEDDDFRQKVLYGYRSFAGTARRNITVDAARMCCYCGRPVFNHAGTAEHRSVAFIGDQKSGKTSTILALAHYVQNAITGAMSQDPIWGGSKGIDTILDAELLSNDERLKADLSKYEDGRPPDKTEKDKEAYSATFRIKNKAQKDKYYILTLTDLPGELCDPNSGKIDVDNIMNRFPVALACEMFILCFDSTTARGPKANRMVENACKWGNEFQKIRQEYWQNSVSNDKKNATGDDCFAPVMILYTKCEELEQVKEDEEPKKVSRGVDRIAESYIFQKERREIEKNEIYSRAGSRFKDYDNLQNVYMARLRCSPFGFAPEVRTDGTTSTPRPIHVDDLMRWILSVACCIDTEATFYPDLSDHQMKKKIPGNFLERPQYRAQKPAGNGKDGDLKEALARCYLFENPGEVDKSLVEVYDNPALLAKARFAAAWPGKKN